MDIGNSGVPLHAFEYRQDYFSRVRRRAIALKIVSPAALTLLWWCNSMVVSEPMGTHHRAIIWLGGMALLLVLILAMEKTRSLQAHGWMTIALLSATSATLAWLAFPSEAGVLWMLPAILIVPVVAAPFWIWMHKNIVACIACYGFGTLAFARIDASAAMLAGYACFAVLSTSICIVSFMVTDRTRRVAYEHAVRLDHYAHHDALTGLPSRRRFLEVGELEVARMRANGTSLSIGFIDLDKLKPVNDLRGHASGDLALAVVAKVIGESLADGMVAARVGGEEFVLLMPGCDGKEAVSFVDRLRLQVSSNDMGGFHVTISAGIAQMKDNETLANTMQRADAALLVAKQAGKDRVVAS